MQFYGFTRDIICTLLNIVLKKWYDYYKVNRRSRDQYEGSSCYNECIAGKM